MKKSLFLIPCLAAALWSCSDKDIVGGGENNGYQNSADTDYSYLAINIVPNVTNTRDGETDTTAEDFRDGVQKENKVSSIRFYFFDHEGKAAQVKGNGATFYDAQETEIDQEWNSETPGPVESIVNGIIVIESPKGDKKPAYMAAVINYDGKAPVLKAGDDDISKLQEYVRDYYNTKSFAMSSTVYKGDKTTYTPAEGDSQNLVEGSEKLGGQEIVAQPVYAHIKNARLDALDDPATIYVERILAKVSVNIDMEKAATVDGFGIYDTHVVIDNGTAEGQDNKIYVKFHGWNVTAARKNSRLIKDIDTSWEDKFSNNWSEAWSDPYNYRSYWAINPDNTKLYDDAEEGADAENIYENNWEFGSFGMGNVINTDNKARKTGRYAVEKKFHTYSDGETGEEDDYFNYYAYLQENAGQYEDGRDQEIMPSKIIVGAQLCDIKGNPLELVKWQENVYTLASARNAIAYDTYLYKRDATDPTKWNRLTGADIRFKYEAVTDETIADSDEAYGGITDDEPYGPARYHVVVELVDEDGDYAIYVPGDTGYILDKGNGDENTGIYEGYPATNDKIQGGLNSVGKIQYWNDGYAYYWVDIRHLGNTEDETGYYGVVRNHWYEYTFTTVTGLGVPVADPDQIIYPEKPKDDPSLFFLAAEIKILSWRLVKQQSEQLGWTIGGENGNTTTPDQPAD